MNTPLSRTVQAFSESMEASGIDDCWMRRATQAVAQHLAGELIVHEQDIGKTLTLQDAVDFLEALSMEEVNV